MKHPHIVWIPVEGSFFSYDNQNKMEEIQQWALDQDIGEDDILMSYKRLPTDPDQCLTPVSQFNRFMLYHFARAQDAVLFKLTFG